MLVYMLLLNENPFLLAGLDACQCQGWSGFDFLLSIRYKWKRKESPCEGRLHFAQWLLFRDHKLHWYQG